MYGLPIALVAAGLILASATTSAANSPFVPESADDTAGYLCDTCDGSPDSEIFCLGYLKGILNTFDAEVASNAHVPYFCVPKGTPLHDVKQAWENYCGAHDSERGARAASIVALSMRKTYPCGGVVSPVQ